MRELRLQTFIILINLVAGRAVLAHDAGTSYLQLRPVDQSAVSVSWDLPGQDLLGLLDPDIHSAQTSAGFARTRAMIEANLLSQMKLWRGDLPCELRVDGLETWKHGEVDYLRATLAARCPAPGLLSLGGDLFLKGDAGRRVLISTGGSPALNSVIDAAQPIWRQTPPVSFWPSFGRFLIEGIWHVLIGYDHVAFVLLLLLPSVLRPAGAGWTGVEGLGVVGREVFRIITAFTLAHSLTLALAVTRMVVLPMQPVEVAIALSICAAAVMNFLPRFSGLRLGLAFGFGLVHGFGFANAVGELETSSASLLPLLAGFNLGVEVAQLAIVAMVLPLIYLMRRARWYSSGVVPFCSCALGAAGFVWLLQRL